MNLLKTVRGTSIWQRENGEYIIQNNSVWETRTSTMQAFALFWALADNVPETDLLYKIANS